MAIVEDLDPPPKNGPSVVLQVALLAGLTVAAAGIGWGSGLYLNSVQPDPASATAADAHKAMETSAAEANAKLGVVYLEPITTNLAAPVEMWIRLELALVFEGESDLAIAQAVHQDVLAYVRTIKIHQIEGASGFQHLKSDLEERAAIRSDGKVKGILIKTLLFE